ncbi:DUF2577 domain-containing protein [Cytobacillus massiliigabonensis]|uniref:DUF2577 domain-containing protein n=1 Tax=Cytobacillus massiliigabonensis TaxID=1871011 RepID=UPI001C125071|nr:DUF2577 domain-containing protein [Cytobacillus massiliigabonensis]
MRNINDFAAVLKKAGRGAVNSTDPVHILYGEVTGISPLKILVEQRLELDDELLILTRAVRDYEVEMTVDHMTEVVDLHAHPYTGRKKFIIHNGLVMGDKVKLLRVQGGQKYVVFDKE